MSARLSDQTTMAVVVDGDLDLFAACRLSEELREHARYGFACLQLDLSLVPWANASALRHLAITRARLADAAGVDLELTDVSPAVQRMSRQARLDSALGHGWPPDGLARTVARP